MTETQITFADINVGDKIRSVSPCGTERVGVAKFVTGTYVDDAQGLTIADPSWTIYRIEPAFTPLPIPEEGQWIRATYGDGHTDEFKARIFDAESTIRVGILGSRGTLGDTGVMDYIVMGPNVRTANSEHNHIIAWEPIGPPAPPEQSAEGWQWTNDDHTEARKGPWTAVQVRGFWGLKHDDFPTYTYTPENSLTKPQAKKPYYELRLAWYTQMRDFNEWNQTAPPEPDWFGPVGTVVEEDGELSYVVRMQGYSNPTYKTVDSVSGRVKGYDWSDILTLGTFTAVKP